MKIIDKRVGNWRVMVSNEECPHLTYPRSDIACEILENKITTQNRIDSYCSFENCPIKEI